MGMTIPPALGGKAASLFGARMFTIAADLLSMRFPQTRDGRRAAAAG